MGDHHHSSTKLISKPTAAKTWKNVDLGNASMDYISSKLPNMSKLNKKKYDKIFNKTYADEEKNLTFKPTTSLSYIKKIYEDKTANPFLKKAAYETTDSKKIKLKKSQNASSAINLNNYKSSNLREKGDCNSMRPNSAMSNIKSQSLLKINS